MQNRQIRRSINNDRGSVLVTALLLIFAASIIGATVVMMTATDLKISGNQQQNTEALFAAEAGVSEAVHRLSLRNPTFVNASGTLVNAAISDDEPYDPNWVAYITPSSPTFQPIQKGSIMIAGSLQNGAGDPLLYTAAVGTDDAIKIEHKWEDRDADGVRDPDEIVLWDSRQVPPENFDEGNPVDVVTVTGRSGNGRRTLQVEVTRKTVFARTLGALYTDKAVEIKGNSAFCGWNHDIKMPSDTRPNACFAYHLADGHLPGVTTTGDAVDEKGVTHDIEGDPAVVDDDPANPWYGIGETLGFSDGEVAQLLDEADNTSIVNPLEGITYIQGDATINSDVVGHGLIYVTGDCVINGGFHYWGLIYVEGDCNITGTPWIMGSLMVKGTSDFNFGAGNCGIVYSGEAIRNFLGMSMPMVTLSWREL